VNRPWFQSILNGQQRFAPLKGPGRRTFEFILRCYATVELRLEPEVEEVLRKMGDYDLKVTEKFYRAQYGKTDYEPGNWPEVWAGIRRAEFAGVDYEDAIRTNRWSLFFLRVFSVQRLVVPLSVLYIAGSFWLLDSAAQGKSPLHLAQFALLGGLVIASIIFINFTESLRIGWLLNKDETGQLKEELLSSSSEEERAAWRELEDAERDTELEAELEIHGGREFYPVISMKPGYITGIRNEFVHDFLILGCFNALILALLLLIQWPIARALSPWTSTQTDAWTIKMLLGTALIPMVLIASLSLGFMVLARLRKFAGILATGLLLAVVPPVLTYAIHGSVGNVVLISSVVTAAIGVLPSAIAELVKQKPNLENVS
jgi:hypothetical protein